MPPVASFKFQSFCAIRSELPRILQVTVEGNETFTARFAIKLSSLSGIGGTPRKGGQATIEGLGWGDNDGAATTLTNATGELSGRPLVTFPVGQLWV